MSVGLVLGERYELRAPLGEGGFGSVWRAHDRRLQRDVAVKLLHVVGADRPRFEREALSLARLNHPNIVTAYDYGADGPTAYLVLELIEGRSLADELAARPSGLPLDRVLDVARQMLDGLAAAHAAGFVHRDLKPHNVMSASGGGQVKIVDFGIAYATDRSRMTATGGLLGTLPYMAPEQLTEGVIDGRADLYSLGCLVYELLTGRSPYNADTPARWMYAHQFTSPVPLRSRRPDVPEWVEVFVLGLLAKDPARRPADATAARALLDALPTVLDTHSPLDTEASPADLAVSPVVGIPPAVFAGPGWPAVARPAGGFSPGGLPIVGPVDPVGPAPGGSPVVLSAGPGVLRPIHTLVGHSAEVWTIAWSPRGERVLSAGEDPVLYAWDPWSGRVVQEVGGFRGPVYSVVWSADGSHFATAGADQQTQIWHAARPTVARRFHRGDSGRAVSWSPDAAHVAVGGPDGLVRVTDVTVSGRAVPYPGLHHDVYAVGWSPDGRWLAATGDRGEVGLWDTDGDYPFRLVGGHAGTVDAMAWSPDGRRLATADERGVVQVTRPSTGETVEILAADRPMFALAWSPRGDALATGGEDGIVRLHDPESGQVLASASAGAEVCALSWAPTGDAVAAAAGTQVRIWAV